MTGWLLLLLMMQPAVLNAPDARQPARGPLIRFESEWPPGTIEFEAMDIEANTVWLLRGVRSVGKVKGITTYQVRLPRSRAVPGHRVRIRACYPQGGQCSWWSADVRIPGERRRAA